ncbi:Sentrin-specific protease 7 [Heracleum sosnowskyi]|uniref:Sentrin-specific protease 7 n=1 Tax=Heracleum sosnowskyi TaxID=360622 RepID=A0AAD8JLP9_9APIA|nr:Sentrin-specific protease 7 [Heracleum sosnowskyi]
MKKSPLDVFDFDEQDNEAELIAAKYSIKLKDSEAPGKSSFLQNVAQKKSKEISNVACVDVDTVNIDSNSNRAASFASINGEDCNVNMSFLDAAPPMISRSADELPQSRPIKVEAGSSFCQIGGCSVPEIALPANTRFKCTRDESSSDESSDAVPDADGSLSERSPSTSSFIGDDNDYGDDNDVPFDGPASDWFGYMQMVDGELGVECFPDYIVYRDKHLTDSVVIFSSSWIKIKSSTHIVEDESFEFQWEVDDVINIESQCCERFEMAMVKIHVISKDLVMAGDLHGTSGIEELKFSIVGDWSGRQNAITSMDVYKPLWKTVLESEMRHNSEVSLGNKAVLLSDHYFPNFDKAFEDLIYPKGEPDAVSISKRDVDLLQPDTFVNDTIIDFYIKYLKNKIEPGERHRFHFFNSFFFRKLADLDKNPSSAVEGRAAFQRVRKWTRKFNVFEKDYLFIPVNFNYHWSLIVICHPGEVAESQDPDPHKSLRSPCILHMDSIRGTHSGLKNLLQSYLCEEWKERQKDSLEDISSRFLNLRFLSLELPQQQNSYDCGLFLLHYVELFLEGVPANFNPFQLTKFSNFLSADWFLPCEASLKRTYIQRMIYDLLDNEGSHKTSPGVGSGKDTSNCSASSLENGTTVGFIAARCSPSNVFCGNTMSSQTGQELELTLLPSILKSPGCNRDSGLVYTDMIESGDAVGSLYQSLEQAAPLNQLNNGVLQMEGEKDKDGYCGSTAAGSGLEQFVATTSQESGLFLSTEFRGEPSWNLGASVHHIVPEDMNLLLETSVCVTDKALDVEVVNHGLEGTNPIFEVNREQSGSPKGNRECLMDCLGSAPSKMPQQVPNNNPDHMNCANEDADLVTMDNGECLMDCLISAPSMIPEQAPNNPDHMHCANEDAGLVTTDNGECLVDCLGSFPSRIPEQGPNNNPDHMQCANEDADLVTTCPTNLLGSSAQDFDAGEEGIKCCKGSQSFSDTDTVTNELHDAKRRKLINLEEGLLPENLARDLHL